MAFEREVNVTKDAIQDIEITFFVPGPANVGGEQSGRLNVQIETSDGKIITRDYDLLLRLQDDTPGLVHLGSLADLRDYIVARLNSEVLPL
jgi:hypothetical protein